MTANAFTKSCKCAKRKASLTVAVVLWDAGAALAKHFVTELGSQTVDAVFAAIPRDQMVTTVMGYSETFAALLRKHNQGVMNATAVTAAQAALRTR